MSQEYILECTLSVNQDSIECESNIMKGFSKNLPIMRLPSMTFHQVLNQRLTEMQKDQI